MKLVYETCENGFLLVPQKGWIRKSSRHYRLSSVKIPGPIQYKKVYMDFDGYSYSYTGHVTGRMVGSVGTDVTTYDGLVYQKIDIAKDKEVGIPYIPLTMDFRELEFRLAMQKYGEGWYIVE